MAEGERIQAWQDAPDEEIACRAQQGDDAAVEFLLDKYKSFVRTKARGYFLIGADHEDIVQEGMIGLFKAIRDYRSDREASFRGFAELCVTRQIITAIKTATRQKHIPLNSYVSLNRPVYEEDSEKTLLDILGGKTSSNPEEMLIDREDFRVIEGQLGQMLTEMEKNVLASYMEGRSYVEIAEETGLRVKSIDNALQRIKRKLSRYLRQKALSQP